jgi:hypothetical protein
MGYGAMPAGIAIKPDPGRVSVPGSSRPADRAREQAEKRDFDQVTASEQGSMIALRSAILGIRH